MTKTKTTTTKITVPFAQASPIQSGVNHFATDHEWTIRAIRGRKAPGVGRMDETHYKVLWRDSVVPEAYRAAPPFEAYAAEAGDPRLLALVGKKTTAPPFAKSVEAFVGHEWGQSGLSFTVRWQPTWEPYSLVYDTEALEAYVECRSLRNKIRGDDVPEY